MACCRYRVLHQRPDRCQQHAGVLCHIGYTGWPRLSRAHRRAVAVTRPGLRTAPPVTPPTLTPRYGFNPLDRAPSRRGLAPERRASDVSLNNFSFSRLTSHTPSTYECGAVHTLSCTAPHSYPAAAAGAIGPAAPARGPQPAGFVGCGACLLRLLFVLTLMIRCPGSNWAIARSQPARTGGRRSR